MAQLKDLIVNGASRLVGDAFVNQIQITAISAPTTAGGTTYSLGNDGQVLKSNGSSIYWGSDSNSVTGVKGNSESSYRTGQVNITAANIGLGNVENTKLSTWAGSTAITTIGTLSTGTVPWARLSGVPSASTTTAGVVQLSSATNSTSESLAATAKAVKAAYDLAASKTNNTGTVTSITLKAGTGITLDTDNTAITTSGIRTISNYRGIEYIRGTWASASGTWTGVSVDSELYDGKQIILFMPFGGSGNATLNLTLADNTTTGAKNVYFESTNRFTTHKGQYSQLHLIYHNSLQIGNNTYEGWWYVANRDTTNIYQLYTANGRVYAGNTGIKPYSIIALDDAGAYSTLIAGDSATGTGTSKTMNTSGKFKLPAQILWYNANNTAAAGALVTSTYQTYIVKESIDVRYSHNHTVTFNTNKPVYIECTIDTNGYWSPTTVGITQVLREGYYYILLGIVYSTEYQVSLLPDHPCYYYDGTNLTDYIYSIITSSDSATVNGHTVNTDVPSNAIFTDTWIPLSTTTAGYVAVAPNSTSKFLRGDAKWESVTKSNVGLGSVANLDQSKAIKTITRNGTTFTYACLDGTTGTFTQQDNNTWNAMTGASSTANGSVGYINATPPSANYNTAFWRADGTWSIPAGTYTLTTATSSILGGVKVGSGLSAATDGKISVNWNGAPVQSVAGMTGTVALKTLNLFSKTYNGAAEVTITPADVGLSGSMTFLGIVSQTLSDGSTADVTLKSNGSSVTKVEGGTVIDAAGLQYVWTNGAWQALGYATDYALNTHIHGNILNNGTLSTTATIASGNHLTITNSSNQIVASSITFGSNTGQYLSNKGTWQNAVTGVKGSATTTFATGNVSLDYNDVGAASSSHTHTNYVQKVGDVMTGALTVKGLIGTADIDYGEVLPETASEGQVFFQLSSGAHSYDIPTGGTEGQVLIKNSSIDGDAIWSNAPTLNNYVKKSGDTMTGNLTIDTTGNYPIILKPWGGNYGTNGTAQIWYCGTDATQSGYYANHLYLGSSGTLPLKIGDLRASVIRTTDNIFAYKDSDCNISVFDTGNNSMRCGILMGSGHMNHGLYSWHYSTNGTSATGSGKWIIYRGNDGEAHSSMKIYGAVWNDYAEYRKSDVLEPGRCIKETGDGELILTTKRLEKGCEIVSDTFGFAIGKTDENKCPTAAVGRVLAYPYEDINEFKKNIGQAVCSGPNGTISIMTDEEVRMWPQCMIGTISEIPSYEYWKAGSQTEEEDSGEELVKVNGRVWIRVR